MTHSGGSGGRRKIDCCALACNPSPPSAASVAKAAAAAPLPL